MSTVTRKLPTITVTATIIAIASDSAAFAIDVRRSDAGSEAAARCPTIPNARCIGGAKIAEVPRTIAGASSEKPATTSSTAT